MTDFFSAPLFPPWDPCVRYCRQAFELELLHELEWRLITPKPHDFLEEFLLALPLAVTPLEADQLRRHAAIFIDMCYTGEKKKKKRRKKNVPQSH